MKDATVRDSMAMQHANVLEPIEHNNRMSIEKFESYKSGWTAALEHSPEVKALVELIQYTIEEFLYLKRTDLTPEMQQIFLSDVAKYIRDQLEAHCKAMEGK